LALTSKPSGTAVSFLSSARAVGLDADLDLGDAGRIGNLKLHLPSEQCTGWCGAGTIPAHYCNYGYENMGM
jgi:hypothetical protein